MNGTDNPVFEAVRCDSSMWRWVEGIAPAVEFDKQSAHELIAWAARQSGLEIRFASEDVGQLALVRTITGSTKNLTPSDALQMLLGTTDLQARIEDCTIIVDMR